LTAQLCQFWFVWFNAFTGTTIYDSLLLTLFNIIFTSLPIIVFAVFDRDVSQQTGMNVPKMYTYGQRSHYYNMRVFWGWILTAFWHSLCCFFIPLLALMTANLMGNRPGEYQHLQYMVYTCVVIVCTLKVGVESASWTIVHHLTFWGSILSWFVICVLYAAVWPAVDKVIPQSSPPGIIDLRYQFRNAYFEFYNTTGNWVYWFAILLACVVALMKDIVWKSIVHNLRISSLVQEAYHVAQVMEKDGVVTEENLRQNCNHSMFEKMSPPKRQITTKPNIKLPSLPSRNTTSDEKLKLVEDTSDISSDVRTSFTVENNNRGRSKSPNITLQDDTTLSIE